MRAIPVRYPKAAVFSWRDEFLTHLFTIIAIFAVLSELLFSHSPITGLPGNVTDWLGKVLLLDGIHNTFTFAAIATVPELRRWSRHAGNNSELRFWLKTAASFAALLILFSVTTTAFWPAHLRKSFHLVTGVTLKTVLEICSLPFLLFPFYHFTWQLKGISALYKQKIMSARQFSEGEKNTAVRVERLEKILFLLLIVSFFTFILVHYQFYSQSSLNMSQGLRHRMERVAVLPTLSFAFLIFANNLRFPYFWMNGKMFYLLRIFVLPSICLGSGFALFLTSAFHGTEYLAITRNLYRNSELKTFEKAKRIRATALIVGITLVAAALVSSTYLFNNVLTIFIGLTFRCIAFTHYFIDGSLFKMRNKQSRELVAPLLVPELRNARRLCNDSASPVWEAGLAETGVVSEAGGF